MTVCRWLHVYYAHNLSTKTPCKIFAVIVEIMKWNEKNEKLNSHWLKQKINVLC